MIEINKNWLTKHWLPGDTDHDYAKGWEILQLIAWPPAWYARQLNNRLRHIGLYETLMRRHLKQKLGRLIDFGCGYGTVLKELVHRDHINITGIDPYAPHPDEHVHKTDIFNANIPQASLDAIFSIETLEHIIDPLAVFDRFHQLLKPGGILLIQTRRQEDPEYQAKQADWFYLKDPQTHISIYSITTMQEIARRTGWKKVQFKGAKYARFQK